MAVASFGGPLALAALITPATIAPVAGSGALATLLATAAFVAPLVIWLRYARRVSGAAGLTGFVEAAAGRRVALLQAAIWSVSYLLYIVYTTVQIVYDLLPAVIPGERAYQSLLALAIPAAVSAVMVAGRAAALVTIGIIAAGQMVLAVGLDGVTLAHLATPVSTLGPGPSPGPLAQASAQTSLLYVCGGLPLFLGGELAAPARTVRRVLPAAYAATAVVVVAAIAPLAAAPGLAATDVPGVRVMEQFSGAGAARALGVGVAVSITGVILCEYLALGRLLAAVTRRPAATINRLIAAALLVAAPLSLIDPEGFYTALLRPSLVALWLSQLIVFAVYPLFAARRGERLLPAGLLAAVSTGLAGYGLWLALSQPGS